MENISGDMRMLSDLQLVYMVPRNSIQLLNINTTKFQVEREPVYRISIPHENFQTHPKNLDPSRRNTNNLPKNFNLPNMHFSIPPPPENMLTITPPPIHFSSFYLFFFTFQKNIKIPGGGGGGG